MNSCTVVTALENTSNSMVLFMFNFCLTAAAQVYEYCVTIEQGHRALISEIILKCIDEQFVE